MLTGKNLRADKAKKMGVVDLLVDPLGPGISDPDENTRRYLEEVAIGVAKQLASGKLKVQRQKSLPDRLLEYALKYDWVKDQVFGKAKAQVMKMSQGLYPAPLRVTTKSVHCITSVNNSGFIDITGSQNELRSWGENWVRRRSKSIWRIIRNTAMQRAFRNI